MKKALIAAVLWIATGGSAGAVGALADITVYDRAENRTLPVYYHEGRHYIVGRPGNEYQVNVRNNHGNDVLAIVSVDGVNAVSGETANWNQSGYVLNPYASFGIKGWRKSLQRTAAFFFTQHDNSYAARTGQPDNVGVIGVAIFRKKAEPPVTIYRDQRWRNEAAPSAKAAQGSVDDSGAREAESAASRAPMQDRALGTGHGRSETSIVRYTDFERAGSAPDEVIAIYYDTYRNLVAQGVLRERPPYLAKPTPFPGQFVPDPR
jgi:hypothetical protein